MQAGKIMLMEIVEDVIAGDRAYMSMRDTGACSGFDPLTRNGEWPEYAPCY
ncbi:hypothetical protein ACFLXA_03925 [Chloroflexota bacterium]